MTEATKVNVFDSRASLVLDVAAGESVAEAAWRELKARLASRVADPELALLAGQLEGDVDAMLSAARQAKAARPADLSARMAQLAFAAFAAWAADPFWG